MYIVLILIHSQTSSLSIMQHDSSSDNSGVDSGPSPIDNAQSTHVGFTIACQESDILKGYLEDFQQADTGGRANIIQMAMGEIYQLRPPNSPFDKKEAGKVYYLLTNVHHSNDME